MTFARATEAVARYDPAAGWVLQAANVGDWFGARFPDDGAEEMFADDPDSLTAAAFHPPLEGVATDGGYRVTGRRPLASTIHDARLALRDGHRRRGGHRGSPSGRTRRGSWTPGTRSGCAAPTATTWCWRTCSCPPGGRFPFVPAFTPGSHYGGPLYRMSVVSVLGAVLAPIALAIAREAIEALRALAPTKMSLGSSTRALRDRSVAHARLGRAEGLVRSARASLLRRARGLVAARRRRGTTPSLEQRAGDLLAGVARGRQRGRGGGPGVRPRRIERDLRAEPDRAPLPRHPDHPPPRVRLREPAGGGRPGAPGRGAGVRPHRLIARRDAGAPRTSGGLRARAEAVGSSLIGGRRTWMPAPAGARRVRLPAPEGHQRIGRRRPGRAPHPRGAARATPSGQHQVSRGAE